MQKARQKKFDPVAQPFGETSAVRLFPDRWEKLTPDNFASVDFSAWEVAKLYGGESKHADFDRIPDDKNGIYILFIQAPLMDKSASYIMYVGKAQKQSLQKRIGQHYLKDEDAIEELRYYWRDHLYVKYLPISDIETIKKTEKKLAWIFHPCCNTLLVKTKPPKTATFWS